MTNVRERVVFGFSVGLVMIAGFCASIAIGGEILRRAHAHADLLSVSVTSSPITTSGMLELGDLGDLGTAKPNTILAGPTFRELAADDMPAATLDPLHDGDIVLDTSGPSGVGRTQIGELCRGEVVGSITDTDGRTEIIREGCGRPIQYSPALTLQGSSWGVGASGTSEQHGLALGGSMITGPFRLELDEHGRILLDGSPLVNQAMLDESTARTRLVFFVSCFLGTFVARLTFSPLRRLLLGVLSARWKARQPAPSGGAFRGTVDPATYNEEHHG